IGQRGPRDHIGEMSAIQPAQRRAATVRACETSVVLKLEETTLARLADQYPEVWRCFAKEFACRLEQRNLTIPAIHQASSPLTRSAAISLVRLICDRFTNVQAAIANRHAQRPAFTIEDEYDVQDLLEGLLRLHFTDVRREEYTPSYAGNTSRMDFLLKL